MSKNIGKVGMFVGIVLMIFIIMILIMVMFIVVVRHDGQLLGDRDDRQPQPLYHFQNVRGDADGE